MKYHINVPYHSAKKLNKVSLIVKLFAFGHNGTIVLQQEIQSNPHFFEFNDPIDYNDPLELDSNFHHQFFVQFQNQTGSRSESVKVTPIHETTNTQ